MMALDELPRVDYAIHSDTTHERAETYAFAEEWTPWLRERGVNVATTTAYRPDIVRRDWGQGAVMIPAFTLSKADASRGQVKRQCTHDWKIMPIRRFLRAELERLGRRRSRGAVECVMGISLDEWHRMRDSDVAYVVNAYPLVDLRITRQGCEEWLAAHGLPIPPKSSCTFCPFHSLAEWRSLKRAGGPDWAEAVAVDAEIRDMRGWHALFVHPHRLRLDDAVLLPDADADLEFIEEQPCDSGVCFT